MKIRTAKIIVDMLMVIILIHELIPTEIVSVRQHFFMGLVFIALIFVHIGLNSKWCISVTKALFVRKGTKNLKRQFILDLLLFIIWSFAGLTGLLAMEYAMNKESGEIIEVLSVFRNIHVALAISGMLLIVVHLYQHKAQVRSYLTHKY